MGERIKKECPTTSVMDSFFRPVTTTTCWVPAGTRDRVKLEEVQDSRVGSGGDRVRGFTTVVVTTKVGVDGPGANKDVEPEDRDRRTEVTSGCHQERGSHSTFPRFLLRTTKSFQQV